MLFQQRSFFNNLHEIFARAFLYIFLDKSYFGNFFVVQSTDYSNYREKWKWALEKILTDIKGILIFRFMLINFSYSDKGRFIWNEVKLGLCVQIFNASKWVCTILRFCVFYLTLIQNHSLKQSRVINQYLLYINNSPSICV